MIDPENVIYKGISELKVLYKTDSYAIASLIYNDKHKYAIRWNGNESDGDLGTPCSHGKPTWFMLPDELVETFLIVKLPK